MLVESDPGQGKTSLAMAMGKAFQLPVLRVQFYEGLTDDKILYDYNYQRQLLSIQAIQSALQENLSGKNIHDAMEVAKTIDFYGKDFLIGSSINSHPIYAGMRSIQRSGSSLPTVPPLRTGRRMDAKADVHS